LLRYRHDCSRRVLVHFLRNYDKQQETVVLDLFRSHRETLSSFLVTARYTPLERLPVGLRLALGIYLQILADGISILNSIITYLDHE
jgi:hypothetical protein